MKYLEAKLEKLDKELNDNLCDIRVVIAERYVFLEKSYRKEKKIRENRERLRERRKSLTTTIIKRNMVCLEPGK